jgi:IclR family acetate operon transcriptional repressor
MQPARLPSRDAEYAERRDDHGGVQVIARAATILRALANSPVGLGLGPLSRLVGLPRSTVQRITTALEAEGFVESGGPDGVRLGSGLSSLAAAIQPAFADMIRPHMEELSRTVGETVVLSRMRGREMTVVDQVIAEHELRFRSRPSASFPLSCTASGKSLLAEMTDEAVSRLLGPELPRLTPTSPPDLQSLLAELAEIRRTGVAYDQETHGVGVCAVAVSIQPWDTRDWTHAVSVVMPTARFQEQLPRSEKALLGFRQAVRAPLSEPSA